MCMSICGKKTQIHTCVWLCENLSSTRLVCVVNIPKAQVLFVQTGQSIDTNRHISPGYLCTNESLVQKLNWIITNSYLTWRFTIRTLIIAGQFEQFI